jgi:hypothetical protein
MKLGRLIAHVFLCLFSTVSVYAGFIDFETLSEGELVTSQFPGVLFSNARVLTAGISLNEFEFPPASGLNVVTDEGGPIILNFLTPVFLFNARFTYSPSLTLTAFDAALNPLASTSSAFNSNLAISGEPVSSPNELLGFAGPAGIAGVVIEGSLSGNSFVMDDLSFTAVPEAATGILVAATIVALAGISGMRRFRLMRCRWRGTFLSE